MQDSSQNSPSEKIDPSIERDILLSAKQETIAILSELANSLKSKSKSKSYMRVKPRVMATLPPTFRMPKEEYKAIKKFCSSCANLLKGLIRCSSCGACQ